MSPRDTSIHLIKHATIVGLVACLVPIAAWAHSSQFAAPPPSTCIPGVAICIFDQSGQATSTGKGTSTQLFMDGTNGSIASTVMQIGGVQGANLGTLTLSTGTLISGTLSGGATFNPGTLTITTTGYNGFTGTLFSGTFGNSTSPIQWIALGKVSGFYQYELIGPISGTWEGSQGVSGETAQLYFHSKTQYTGGKITLASGTTGIVIPEPASVGLLGTGLIAMGFLVRRKAKRD